MSFCPECGKAVAPESAKCASCGFALPQSEQKTAGARFKGTVMMTAPIIDTAPANVNAKKPAPAVAQEAAVSEVVQPKVAANAGGKPEIRGGRGSAKATMIGAGVPAEVIAAAQAHAAGAAKINAKSASGVGGQPEPQLTAAGAQPQAKIGAGALPQRKIPAAAPSKPITGPQAKAAPPTNLKATPLTNAKPAAAPINAKATPIGAKAAVPQTNPKVAAPAQSPVSATANTDEPPQPTPSVRAMMNVPISQPPAQFAATQAALPVPPPRPASHVQEAEPSIVVTAEEPAAPAVIVEPASFERQERYLPGDPMAPQPAPAMRERAPRTTIPGNDELSVPRDERKWLYWAVCGVVVLVVLLLAIGLF